MNKKVRSFLPFIKSQTFQKYASLILLVVLLIALPLILFEVKQQQTVGQHASTKIWNSGYDSCGHIYVYFISETPNCASQTAYLNSYYSTVGVKSVDGHSYTIHAEFDTFWCENQKELGGFGNPIACLKRPYPLIKDYPIDGTGTSISAPVRQPSDGFSYCGTYQNDFSFYYTDRSGNTCRFGWPALDPIQSHEVVADGYCTATQVNCVASTPTPTPSPTPGVTITPTDTPTDTPTPGLTLTPTASPSATPTDTPTPNPSDTPTNTPAPSSSPTDTPTPGATITPKPTLPPTGPGDTIVGIGVVGALVAVIGLVFAVGL